MPTLKIDDREFDLDTLPEAAKQQLQMLQVTEAEIGRLNAQIAIAQTARLSYLNALKQHLPTPLEQVQAQGETLKFS